MNTTKLSSCDDHSLVTCLSLASMSFSFRAGIFNSNSNLINLSFAGNQTKIPEMHTSSMSSLFCSRGASRMSFRQNPGLSRSNVKPVMV